MYPKITLVLILLTITKNILSLNVCEDRFTVITDIKQKDCPAGSYLRHNANDCFPKCVEIDLEKGDEKCKDDNKCLPAYKCQGNHPLNKYCELDTNSCLKYHYSYVDREDGITNHLVKSIWKPICLPDGSWAPKQCKGEVNNGRCFCYDRLGHRIDGHAWSTQSENMTCACSRRKADMLEDPNVDFVGFHCDDQGNYEPLQCHDGICYCAEPKSGDVLSKIVPEKMMKRLPCYSQNLNGEEYLRQCESHLHAQTIFLKELMIHGTTEVSLDLLQCDFDGTYGRVKIADNQKQCAWKDNERIAPFYENLSNGAINSDMNCFCARDAKLFALIGQVRPLECQENGNYKPLQKVRSGSSVEYICVDSDGFQNNYESVNESSSCDKYNE